jgi:hypothetical protein
MLTKKTIDAKMKEERIELLNVDGENARSH